MALTKEERVHLLSLVESNIHHEILDEVLSELSPEDKERFLALIAKDEHDEVWSLLMEKVDNVEVKIRLIAEAVKKELHADIYNETKK